MLFQTDNEELNRDFKIETISGNARVLNDLKVSAIIRGGDSHFYQVTLNEDSPTIKPTIFDSRHGLNEWQLENRELFRHAPNARVFESENHMMTHLVDHSYRWHSRVDPKVRIAVKNKQSGNVEVINHTVAGITRQDNINRTFFMEVEGEYYYILNIDGHRAMINSFNPETLKLEYVFTHHFG